MAYVPARAPSVPAGAQITGKAQADFEQVKGALSKVLDSMPSFELVPSGFEKVMMKFTETGSEAQAKTFQASLVK
jgi:hypothetical protein